MKVLVVLFAVVAVSRADILGGGVIAPGLIGAGHGLGAPAVAARVVPAADAIPAALNGLSPLGTPIDTPAVQAARATHAVAVANNAAISAPRVIAAPAVVAAPAVSPAVVAPGVIGAGVLGAGVYGGLGGVVAPGVLGAGVYGGLGGVVAPGVIGAGLIGNAGLLGAAAHLNAKLG